MENILSVNLCYCWFGCFVAVNISPVFTYIPFVTVFVFPEQVFAGFANLVNALFEIGKSLIADFIFLSRTNFTYVKNSSVVTGS
jgi:hypothetical protein